MKHTLLKTVAMGVLLLSFHAFASTPDGLITSKTKLSLWTTAGLKSTSVHVDTNDGVVTLHGKVATAAQKGLADKTTREVTGVRGVRNLLQVVPAAEEKRVGSSDKDLKALVEQRLKADAALKDSKVSVKSVNNGVVLLTGEAHTVSDHLRAVMLTDRVPGVNRVSSEIKGPNAFGDEERVSKATSEAHSSARDMETSMAVKLRLFAAPQVPSAEINVDTDEGIVTLFGIVPTAEVKNAAGVEASKAAGVRAVENQLEVVASAQKERVDAKDADISGDLALAFKDRGELQGVKTEVKNGVVRITGTVSSGWNEVNALRTARRVAGVREVENQLKVEDKTP